MQLPFLPTTAALVLVFVIISAAAAGVGDPTLRTDHPHYAGEGAFQTIEDCVRFATEGKRDEQDKAIALYLWILAHQWHLASPQEWNAPGEVPDTARSRDDLIVFDANRARFSYGYALCGTVHAWNEPYWRALGMPVRRRAFPGHVNSEVFYKDGWHAFDTDMAGLVFRKDGIVAGYDDIRQDPSLVKHSRPPIPCYPFAWPSDFNGMKKGWQQIAAGGKWYRMYNSGYAAHPGIVQLRRGESFTRWFDRDHWGGPSKRRFWHNQPGGPFRNWTFANLGTPEHRGGESNSRGNASYCNGEFVYRPNLAAEEFLNEIVDRSANLVHRKSSPRLGSRDGKPASITFGHFSPYVICGDPVDDANPMSGKATDGLVVSGQSHGQVQLEVSADQGQTWQDAGTATGEFRIDLTEAAKGRYGWQVRLLLTGDAGLDDLAFTTTTQVCQTIYPRLKAGGCNVAYRSASRAVVPVLPNLGLAEDKLTALEVRELRSTNVVYQPRSAKSRVAYRTTNNKPGQVVFKIDSGRQRLTEVRAAARFRVRVPPPENCDYRLEISTDNGKTWRLMRRADVPADNEFSSGWVDGQADLSGDNVTSALVRVGFYQGGYQTGLIDMQFYGVHQTPPPAATKVTYGWKEAGKSKTHAESIPAVKASHKFTVPTGDKITDEFVRIEVP